MKHISSVVCNEQAQIVCLIKDEHDLFDDLKEKSLFEIVDAGSEEKLSRFLEITKDEKAIANWEINVIKDDEIETLIFSGIFCADNYFVQITSTKFDIFFYPYNLDQTDFLETPSREAETESSHNKFNEISQLNNELINTQRELSQKNRQLGQLNERLEILATTDPLTGIFNRRAILDRAEIELKRAAREGRIFTLAILDLDKFKPINDRYGHQAGDKALKYFADCLKQSTREYDAAGRIGGDEFLIFFSLENSRQFSEILRRLLNRIKNGLIEVDEKNTLRLNASIGGVYVEPDDAPEIDIEKVINQADKMLYKAKNDKENEIIVSAVEK